MLFAYAARIGLDIFHFDVDIAYLNGELEQTIYMRQPQGFVKKDQEQKVCKLKKSFYGLKQSGRAWNNTLDKNLRVNIEFKQAAWDRSVYYYRNPHHKNLLIILAVYVDDIILFTNSQVYLNHVQQI